MSDDQTSVGSPENNVVAPVRLVSDRLVMRQGKPEDRAEIVALFACTGVKRWWGTQSDEDVEEVIARSDPEMTVLLIERDGAVIGVIQFHEEEDPMYRHAGIDIAIHDGHQRQGIGTEAITAVIDHLFASGHHRIVIDPNAANSAAIAAYGALGFEPVGTMGQYEWSEHEQRWTDGVLMELLRTQEEDETKEPR